MAPGVGRPAPRNDARNTPWPSTDPRPVELLCFLGPTVSPKRNSGWPRSQRLIVEQLEARDVRAVVGLPWRDPTHLTLSFAPDGTSIDGEQSSLFQTLNASSPAPPVGRT